jgi:hypothetical protein
VQRLGLLKWHGSCSILLALLTKRCNAIAGVFLAIDCRVQRNGLPDYDTSLPAGIGDECSMQIERDYETRHVVCPLAYDAPETSIKLSNDVYISRLILPRGFSVIFTH